MSKRSRLTGEIIRVKLSPAQSRRLANAQQAAVATAALRDNILSALIEGVTDRDLKGWTIQINENEIVVTSPGPLVAVAENGNGANDSAQAGVMTG